MKNVRDNFRLATGAVKLSLTPFFGKRTQRIDIKTAQRIAAEWERGS